MKCLSPASQAFPGGQRRTPRCARGYRLTPASRAEICVDASARAEIHVDTSARAEICIDNSARAEICVDTSGETTGHLTIRQPDPERVELFASASSTLPGSRAFFNCFPAVSPPVITYIPFGEDFKSRFKVLRHTFQASRLGTHQARKPQAPLSLESCPSTGRCCRARNNETRLA